MLVYMKKKSFRRKRTVRKKGGAPTVRTGFGRPQKVTMVPLSKPQQAIIKEEQDRVILWQNNVLQRIEDILVELQSDAYVLGDTVRGDVLGARKYGKKNKKTKKKTKKKSKSKKKI